MGDKIYVMKVPEEQQETMQVALDNIGLEWASTESEKALFEFLGYKQAGMPDLSKYKEWAEEVRHVSTYPYRAADEDRGLRKTLGWLTLATIDIAETLAGVYGKQEEPKE